jgi:S1-C subfamily serine protease
MAVAAPGAVALRWDGRALAVLDQTQLPAREAWLDLTGAADTAVAIRRLAVRGAPLIGIVAAYGLAMEVARRPELGALERGAAPAHAYLGVETAPAAGPGGGTAVAVVAVQGGGPAARAGLRAGDIVEELDGRPLRGVNDLIASVASHRPGQAVTLGVRRGARHLRLRVVLGLQPTTSSAG